VLTHVLLHVLAGLAAGAIAWRLPQIAGKILSSQPSLPSDCPDTSPPPIQGRYRALWRRRIRGLLVVALTVALVAWPGLATSGSGPWYARTLIATGRAVAVIVVFTLIIGPAIAHLIHRAVRRTRQHSEYAETLAMVHELRQEAVHVWREAGGRSVPRRVLHCLLAMFASALVAGDAEASAATGRCSEFRL
jgi:multisubunit Na+/H+ antiporter MnhG subunit